ncbi:MAG: LacI family DNA-binding transcriptional regulator [Bacteroidales bacterium]
MRENKDITIYDVAKALGLSPSTVSRALKNHPHISSATKKKILACASEMGYRHNKFASNLRQKRTNTIGVVVPKLKSYFMASVLSGIEKETSRNGYGLIITQSQESWEKEIVCINTLFNSSVDGLLVSLASDTENANHFKSFFNRGIPIVFFDRVMDCNGCVNVVIDNYKAGYELTSHLISRGCRKIMHLGGNMLRNVYYERFRGYRQALIDNNIEFDNKMLVVGDMSNKTGIDLVNSILKMKHRPDGIFTSNDTTGVTIILELQKAGIRVPDEIAVAGFNNEPVSQYVTPNLTTVDYPAREMGELAIKMLLNKLNDPQDQNLNTVILNHKLIIRQSSLKES